MHANSKLLNNEQRNFCLGNKCWSKTKQNRPVLIDEVNYHYVVNGNRTGTTYYECRAKKTMGCKVIAQIKTLGGKELLLVKGTHIDQPTPTTVQSQRFGA